MAAIHSGRVKLKVKDIEFISSIEGNKSIEEQGKTLEVDVISSSRGKGEESEGVIETNQDIIEIEDLRDKQVET